MESSLCLFFDTTSINNESYKKYYGTIRKVSRLRNESISIINMTKSKERKTATITKRRTMSATTITMDDDIQHHYQNNKLSLSYIATTTSPTDDVVASNDNNEDNSNNHHLYDSIISTSSLLAGNFIPNDVDSDDDDNSEEEEQEDNDNVSYNTKQQRNHNRQLSSLLLPSTPSSPTLSNRRSMTRLLSRTSSRKQQPQQLSNSNKKEKKRLFSRRSFRHSHSCSNDIDISSRQGNNKSDDRNLKKKRYFLFNSKRIPKSNINNDIEEKENQQHYDLRSRTTSSFDIACTSSNDNDSNCSCAVASIEDMMMMDYDNAMINNIGDCSYNCNENKKNVENDSHIQPQVQEQLPDLYGQMHVNETPELVEESLQQMNIELNKHNDKNERFAEEKCLMDNKKINFTRIKLLFLRACCFRINEAVAKYIKYWNKRMLLFGMERAFNPLTLSSLTPSELHILETGTIGIVKKQHSEQQYSELIQQTTTTTTTSNDDKSIETRDIIIFDYTLYDKKIMATLDYSRVKWYIFHSIMEDNGSSQRGVIIIVVMKNCIIKQLPSFDFMKTHMSYFQYCVPIRLSGMHIVYMPAVIRFVVPILNQLVTEIVRQRLIFHTDIKNEIQCITKLYNQYGISSNMIPKHIGGTYEWNIKHIWIPKQLLYESNNVVEI